MINQSVTAQINQVLQDEARLIKRTQLKRSQYKVVGKRKREEEEKKEEGEEAEETDRKRMLVVLSAHVCPDACKFSSCTDTFLFLLSSYGGWRMEQESLYSPVLVR